MHSLWDLALALAALIVAYACIRGIVVLIWPRKVEPHEYENSESWGNQDFDTRKPRRRR